MPRLTNKQYLEHRQALRRDWYEDRAWTFGQLEPIEEMELHRYFAPTEDFTNAEALAYRASITKQYPSLPQAAGRAYAHALAHLGKRPAPQPFVKPESKGKPVRGGKVVVRTVMNPHPDIHKLIRALDQIREDEERKSAA